MKSWWMASTLFGSAPRMKLNRSTKWMPSANITPLSLRGRLKPPKWPRIMFTLPNSPFCTASRSQSVAGSKRKMCPTCKMRLCFVGDFRELL